MNICNKNYYLFNLDTDEDDGVEMPSTEAPPTTVSHVFLDHTHYPILRKWKKASNQMTTMMMIVPGVTPVILVVAVIVMTEVTGLQGSTGILLNTSSKESKFFKCITH